MKTPQKNNNNKYNVVEVLEYCYSKALEPKELTQGKSENKGYKGTYNNISYGIKQYLDYAREYESKHPNKMFCSRLNVGQAVENVITKARNSYHGTDLVRNGFNCEVKTLGRDRGAKLTELEIQNNEYLVLVLFQTQETIVIEMITEDQKRRVSTAYDTTAGRRGKRASWVYNELLVDWGLHYKVLPKLVMSKQQLNIKKEGLA